MTLGSRIQELREEKNISRKHLAQILKISYSAMSKYETNERFPEKEILVQLADYFNVSIDYLIGRSNIRVDKDLKIALNALSTDGLDDNDIEMVKNLIDNLRSKNRKS